MGDQIQVEVAVHPPADEASALGLNANPRSPSPTKVGTRGAYESAWTVRRA